MLLFPFSYVRLALVLNPTRPTAHTLHTQIHTYKYTSQQRSLHFATLHFDIYAMLPLSQLASLLTLAYICVVAAFVTHLLHLQSVLPTVVTVNEWNASSLPFTYYTYLPVYAWVGVGVCVGGFYAKLQNYIILSYCYTR